MPNKTESTEFRYISLISTVTIIEPLKISQSRYLYTSKIHTSIIHQKFFKNGLSFVDYLDYSILTCFYHLFARIRHCFGFVQDPKYAPEFILGAEQK